MLLADCTSHLFALVNQLFPIVLLQRLDNNDAREPSCLNKPIEFENEQDYVRYICSLERGTNEEEWQTLTSPSTTFPAYLDR